MLSRFAVSQLTVYYTTVNLSLGLPHPVTTCSHAAGCRLVRYILPGPFCIDMLLTLSHRTQDSVIANFRPHPIIKLKSIDMVPRVPLLTLLVRPNYINKWPVVAKSRLLAFHTCPCLFSINSTSTAPRYGPNFYGSCKCIHVVVYVTYTSLSNITLKCYNWNVPAYDKTIRQSIIINRILLLNRGKGKQVTASHWLNLPT